MAKLIYWCTKCAIPLIEQSVCPICGSTGKQIATNGVCNPVFTQEKRLMSCILDEDIENANVWYLGGGRYLVDGKKVRLPFVEYYKSKKHLEVAGKLRSDISNASDIYNLDKYLQANQSHLNDLIYDADEYIRSTIAECNAEPGHKYIPTVSFSGGKDSTVVSSLSEILCKQAKLFISLEILRLSSLQRMNTLKKRSEVKIRILLLYPAKLTMISLSCARSLDLRADMSAGAVRFLRPAI